MAWLACLLQSCSSQAYITGFYEYLWSAWWREHLPQYLIYKLLTDNACSVSTSAASRGLVKHFTACHTRQESWWELICCQAWSSGPTPVDQWKTCKKHSRGVKVSASPSSIVSRCQTNVWWSNNTLLAYSYFFLVLEVKQVRFKINRASPLWCRKVYYCAELLLVKSLAQGVVTKAITCTMQCWNLPFTRQYGEWVQAMASTVQ